MTDYYQHGQQTHPAGMSTDGVIECGEPCDPNNPCPVCEEYWERMEREGFWVSGIGWTEKGMKEMRK